MEYLHPASTSGLQSRMLIIF